MKFRYLSRFFYILSGKKRQLVLLIFAILFSSMLEAFGIGLVGPFMSLATDIDSINHIAWLKWFYTNLGFRSDIQFVSFFGLAVVGILYLKSVTSFLIQKYIFEFGFGQQAELRLRLMSAYLRAPYMFHLNRNSAHLIQNILKETQNFASMVLMPALFSCANLLVTFALMVLLFRTDMFATASILILFLLLAMLLYRFKNELARWGQEGHEADVEMIRAINHGLGGLKEVKVVGCESYFEDSVAAQADRFKISISAANIFSNLPRYILEPLLITCLVVFVITYLVENRNPQQLTATLGVFGMASIRLLPAASNLAQSIGLLWHSSYVIDKLYLDLKEVETGENELSSRQKALLPPAHRNGSSPDRAIAFDQKINLHDIRYYYPGSQTPSLNGVSLEIRKGQSVALIGKSGAGKTTIVDVILGLLMPESGDIRVDGMSIYSDLRAWQDLIAYIPQSIFLTDDSIRHNIAFGVPEAEIDPDRLDRAIRLSQLSDLVESLPEGVETLVGERGVRLSGGQRQRIGIARALYHEREILVLDEATAALDNETEGLITEAIKSLSGSRTMIIIAHRLSTIEHCDRVYVLEKGQVVNSGSYQEVVLAK